LRQVIAAKHAAPTVIWPVWVMARPGTSRLGCVAAFPRESSSMDRQELIDTCLVNDDQDAVFTVEVWAAVTYSDEFGVARRTVGVNSFCLGDGSRLIRHGDDGFINTATGKVLRRLLQPQVAHNVVAALAALEHTAQRSTNKAMK
jgi:hypothetical protein